MLTQSQVKPFFDSHDYSFPVLLDPDQQVSKSYSVELCPDTFVILPDRRIVYQDIGYLAGEEQELLEVITACLSGDPPAEIPEFIRPKRSTVNIGSDPLLEAIFFVGAPEPEHIVTSDELEQMLYNYRVEEDDIEGYKWYSSKSSPQHLNANAVLLYIGSRGDSPPWLRLRIQYTADEWLFIEQYAIKTDQGLSYITAASGEVARKAGYGGISEWLDRALTLDDFRILQSILASKETKIRYKGQQFSTDRTISRTELRALQETIDLYELLILAYLQGVEVPSAKY